jgi:hypothetical protein|mmetsp:Transcript_66881/g.111926  ORF Transcript_66881/g.111926 Transcript_66881/m.111926 type:complete len:82 (+) Transcript_66881:245-490(+)
MVGTAICLNCTPRPPPTPEVCVYTPEWMHQLWMAHAWLLSCVYFQALFAVLYSGTLMYQHPSCLRKRLMVQTILSVLSVKF